MVVDVSVVDVVVVGGTVVVVVVVGGTVVVVVVVVGGTVVVVVVVVGGGGLVVVVVVGGTVVGVVTTGGAEGLDEVVVVTGAAGVPKVKGSVTKEGREVVACGFVLPLALLAWEMRNGKGDGSVEVVGVEVGVVEVLGGAVDGVVPVTNGRPLWRGDVVAEAEVFALEPLPMSSALMPAMMTTPAMMIDQRQKVSSPLVSSATATSLPPHDYEFYGTPVWWFRCLPLSVTGPDEGGAGFRAEPLPNHPRSG